MRILKAVEDVNESQKSRLFYKAMQYFGSDLKGKTIALWGLSFKPKTDDMREAPALILIDKLIEQGAKVKAYDPVAMEESERRIGNKIEYCEDKYGALVDADALMLVTEWPEFRISDFEVMKKLLKTNVIFDGRNLFEREDVEKAGFDYFNIGTEKK